MSLCRGLRRLYDCSWFRFSGADQRAKDVGRLEELQELSVLKITEPPLRNVRKEGEKEKKEDWFLRHGYLDSSDGPFYHRAGPINRLSTSHSHTYLRHMGPSVSPSSAHREVLVAS